MVKFYLNLFFSGKKPCGCCFLVEKKNFKYVFFGYANPVCLAMGTIEVTSQLNRTGSNPWPDKKKVAVKCCHKNLIKPMNQDRSI